MIKNLKIQSTSDRIQVAIPDSLVLELKKYLPGYYDFDNALKMVCAWKIDSEGFESLHDFAVYQKARGKKVKK
jgi:hypothetical protein